MQLQSMTIQGFRSFTGQQEVLFAKLRPGLYHLAGKNEVEPAISPNGAGKSSLLEGPCWLAYGTTSRKLKAGSVGNWARGEQCGGILEVKTAQHALGIFRTWNPKGGNALEVSIDGAAPRPIDQKELDGLLGLSFDAYLFSVYFAQFAPAFIDLKPAEQMSVYSTVLGLDVWERAGDAAGKQGRDLELKLMTQKEGLARLEGRLEAERSALAAIDPEEKVWLQGMVQKEEELTKAVEGAKKSIKAAEVERDKHAVGSKSFRELRGKVQKAQLKSSEALGKEAYLQREIEALTKRDLKNCPTCGASLKGNDHIKSEVTKKKTLLATAVNLSQEASTQHLAVVDEMNKFRDEEVKLLEAEKKLSGLGADHQNATLALERLLAEVSPFDARRATAKQSITSLTGVINDAKKTLEGTEQAQGAAVYWSKSFKELRLSLIEESLTQLSMESNSALVQLGLSDWNLEFDVERETKKGTVSKGFTILVHAPHVKEPVPWECWSGGESQRLRVAASLGFAELICSRMGVAPNMELWDEPSQWLSEGGIYDLLSSLASRAERKKKVIILADHRALDFGGFAGSIMVTKKATGSEIHVV